MKNDIEELRSLNLQLAAMESQEVQVQRDWFGKHLASAFAFRRASKDEEDRSQFLDKLSKKPPRTTNIESIELLGDARAIVRAVVTVHDAGPPQRFHNVRLFIATADGWKLLAWANEGPLPT